MIPLNKTIISDELLQVKFSCDLTKCKGACCILGDAGAPLEDEEIAIIEEVYEKFKPYMEEKGKKSVKKNGFFVVDDDGEYVTPLVPNTEECAYVYFDNGIAKCAIEKAWIKGKISFRKPISCHLYPIRIKKYDDFEAVNCHEWSVCKSAFKTGAKNNIPLLDSAKDSLIRKYGKEWYNQLIDFASNSKRENDGM